MKDNWKEKVFAVGRFILKHGKIVFPILLMIAVAITVSIALRAKASQNTPLMAVESTPEGNDVSGGDLAVEVPNVPLEQNAYPEVNTLIYTYYNALANGDVDTISSITNVIDDMGIIRIQELGKYFELYPTIEVYTKPGPIEGSYIVIAYTKVTLTGYEEEVPGYQSFYVCTADDGSLYFNQGEVSEEEYEYINEVILQEDLVELCNRITVECNDVYLNHPEIFNYVTEIENSIKVQAGVMLAEQVSSNDTSEGDGTEGEVNETETIPEETAPEENGPVTATANTTVNVRSSDSETADKLGKLTGGDKVTVLEQKVNGWSRIQYEGKDGYVKSEYLSVAESASGVTSIGTVTATTNINVRASASETAEKIGVVAGGDTLELVANENGWCKVVYDGQIGYVKADYVQ